MDEFMKNLFGENAEEKKDEITAAPQENEAPAAPASSSIDDILSSIRERATESAQEVSATAAETPDVPEEAPELPEEAPEAPVEAEMPETPEAVPEAAAYDLSMFSQTRAAEPTEEIPTAEAPTQAPAYAPYQAPTGGVYYQPPTVQPTYQASPAYTPQPGEQPLPDTPKKKKRKAPILIIALIALLCVAVAAVGVHSAMKNYNAGDTEKTTSANPLEGFLNNNDDSKDNNTEASDDAQASVKSSDEAAKKDTKGNLTVAGLAAESKGSCVGITVYTDQQNFNYFDGFGMSPDNSDGEEVASGEGSGVIMSEANGKTYIMTCAHVIADGSKFTVTLDNDKEYEAKMVGYDSQTDIGVLSIEAKGLQIAEFGDSKQIEVGEDCVAIGCPGGLQFKNSVTKGIVSALDVPVSSSIGYNNECIQVDAAINPGNSGGALFNMQGQVIGINSSKIASTEYEGMGFAVPSNTAVETANSLIKNGYVKGRAKLGISYNTLDSYNSAQAILQALNEQGYKNAAGTMIIQNITDDSDLNGKVNQYDMIVAINGKTLTSIDVLTSVLSKSKPGDTVKLTIARIENNQLRTFDINCKLVEAKE